MLPWHLHVVTAIANPWRYASRYRLYREFEAYIKASGATLTTVEAAFRDRPHAVTLPNKPNHIQVRTECEIWHKESLLNIGIRSLPRDWQYVAWIDADVQFIRPDWVEETLQLLQHYYVVQMFGEAQDLGPHFEPFMRHEGFVKSYQYRRRSHFPGRYGYWIPQGNLITWHPGFAWAIRRETFEAIGGLLDFAILGAGDNHMAKGWIGDAAYSLPPKATAGYLDAVLAWQRMALLNGRKNIGYVPGLLVHRWHGNKANRRYWNRWKILTENAFDPHTDLYRDRTGLWCLGPNKWKLRDLCRDYFKQRNEDSTELDESEIRM